MSESLRHTRTQHILQRTQDQLNTIKHVLGSTPVDLQEVYTAVEEEVALARGGDWSYYVCEPAGIAMLYGHNRCNKVMFAKWQTQVKQIMEDQGITDPGVFPLRSNDWGLYRTNMAQTHGPHQPGHVAGTSGDGWAPEDEYGGSFIGGKYSHWGCPGCCDLYYASQHNQTRILVFGATNRRGTQQGYDPEAAYVGHMDPATDNEFSALKNATLLGEIKDDPNWDRTQITPQVVMEALKRLNKRFHDRLTHSVRCVTLFVPDHADEGDPQTTSKAWNKRLFCEDRRLSVQNVGTELRAILFQADSLPTLTKADLTRIIDFCCSFLNMDLLLAKTNTKYHGKRNATVKMVERLRTRGLAMRALTAPPPSNL
jgi:hypothetical protein